MPKPGPLNLITDVPGLSVGHATDEKAGTGVTALVCDTSYPAAADVRGGGPGTRETHVLSPENLVGRADAVVLSGGSVFGLGAADGATSALSLKGKGLKIVDSGPTIPIVPAAVLHDLANPGDKNWGDAPPYRGLGVKAVDAAAREFALGSVGAGRGAMAGLVKGGIGSVSLDLGDGLIVGALAAANCVGSALLPDGETFYAWPYEIDGEFGGHRPADDFDLSDPFPDLSRLSAGGRIKAGANTTLAVVATSADLTTAECQRLAMMAQDGIARAVRPAHAPFDGDVAFALATGAAKIAAAEEGAVRPMTLARIGSAAADCLARAIARAVYAARDVG